MNLHCLGPGLGGEHARTGPKDSGSLRGLACEHSRVVGEEDERKMEAVTHLDEVGGLVRCVDIDGSGDDRRLVGDDADGFAADAGERTHDR